MALKSLNLERSGYPQLMRSRLTDVAKTYTLRCDAKQSEKRFREFAQFIHSVETFQLGDYLPEPLPKGDQPKYLETLAAEGVPVISTICIQDLSIDLAPARYIDRDDFDAVDAWKKPGEGDVLLTVDGGTSIGKPAIFGLEDDCAIDSHVVILRPSDLDPRYVAYLLASPLGQVQFNRAESGASGQTAVTEDDIRRFRFPVVPDEEIPRLIEAFEKTVDDLRSMRSELQAKEADAWRGFNERLIGGAAELP